MMKKKYASDLLEGIHESAQGLLKVGAISLKEMKEFDNLCFEPDGSVTDIDPFKGLISSDYQSLAEQIGVNLSFVQKLKNRNIIYSTIPQPFVKKASEVIGIHVNQLIAYLSDDECAPSDKKCAEQNKDTVKSGKLSFEKALE